MNIKQILEEMERSEGVGFAMELAASFVTALVKKGQFDEALDVLSMLRKSEDLPHELEVALSDLAVSLRVAGRTDEAILVLEKAGTFFPNSTALAFEEATALRDRGDLDKSRKLLESVMRQAPGDARGWKLLGEAWLALNEPARAWDAWKECLDRHPSLGDILAVHRKVREMGDCLPRSASVRVGLLSSFTVDPLVPFLELAAMRQGLGVEVYLAPFGQYAQELLAEGGNLAQFQPHAVFIALSAEAVLGASIATILSEVPDDRVQRVDRAIERLEGLLDAGLRNTDADLFIHNFSRRARSPLGIADEEDPMGEARLIERLNRELARLARERSRVHIFAEERLRAQFGGSLAFDPRMWYLGQIPWRDAYLPEIACEYTRCLKALLALTAKCVVVDLDGVLWGGILGEDGYDGIQLGAIPPGNMYRDFQAALLECYNRGMLLAVCSKNNEEEALRVIREHPDMVLREQHFGSFRINWQDKASNIAKIAQELNIGVDSLLFIDDTPEERALVRQLLPEVRVPEWPDDPALYRSALESLADLDVLKLTREDLKRGQMYAAQRERREFEQNHASLEDFYSSLDMEVRVEKVSEFTLPRAAQLVLKTNQFNLTTKRHTEADLKRWMSDPAWGLFVLSTSDRFGDSGIAGVAICEYQEAVCRIDSFLMSCRILGRTIETAFLSVIVGEARSRGCTTIQGEFRPTAKNAPARDFYSRHGFLKQGEENDSELWALPPDAAVEVPSWIRLEAPERAGVHSQ